MTPISAPPKPLLQTRLYAAPLKRSVETVEKLQIGTILLKQLAEAKSWMEMEIPTKARQSLRDKDLNTLPEAVSISAVLLSCIAADSSACEKGLFLQSR